MPMHFTARTVPRPAKLASLVAQIVATLALAAPAVFGQQPDDVGADLRPPPECFRFVFGAWDPPLDWARAGHQTAPPVGEYPTQGRGSAARTGYDEPLLLFPSFWPVGVVIRFDSGAQTDTLRGTATALQADASRAPSRTRVVAVRFAC